MGKYAWHRLFVPEKPVFGANSVALAFVEAKLWPNLYENSPIFVTVTSRVGPMKIRSAPWNRPFPKTPFGANSATLAFIQAELWPILSKNSQIFVTMATRVGRRKNLLPPLNRHPHHLHILAIHYELSFTNVRASNHRSARITWPLTLTLNTSWMRAFLWTIICKFGSECRSSHFARVLRY